MRFRLSRSADHTFRSRRGRVRLDEDRVAQRHLEIVEPVADQRLERHRIDITRLDALENLVVKVDGLFLRQPKQDIAKTAVGITAVELEMNLAEAKATAEVRAAGPALDGIVIGLDRRGPVARALLVETALEHALGIIGQTCGPLGRRARISPGVIGVSAQVIGLAIPASNSRNDQPRENRTGRRIGVASPAWERSATNRSSPCDALLRKFNGACRSYPRLLSRKLGVWRESGETCTLLRPQIPCAPLRRCRSMESFHVKAARQSTGPIPEDSSPLSPVRNGAFDRVSPFKTNYNTHTGTIELSLEHLDGRRSAIAIAMPRLP